MRLRVTLGLCLLLGLGPVLAQENLIRDSLGLEAPEPTTAPNLETHVGAYLVPLPVGSTFLPGWTITRKGLKLFYPRGGEKLRAFDLGPSGGLAQSVPTLAGHTYRLDFRLVGDGEGPPKQDCVVTAAGHSRTFAMDNKRSDDFDWIITATGPNTNIEFAGSHPPGGGPLLVRPALKEYDPKVEALRPGLTKAYRAMDKAARRGGDLQAYMVLVAPDFTLKSKTGEVTERSAYESLMRKQQDQGQEMTTSMILLQASPDGATVSVERRLSGDDGSGHRVVTNVSYKDTWLRAGDKWLLKASEELP